MLIRKLSVFLFAAVLSVTALYAQKPTWVGVCERITENMPGTEHDALRSLTVEYFKSELATRSGIEIADSTKLKNAIEELKIKNIDFSPEEIRQICTKIRAGALCVIKKHPGTNKQFMLTATVYDKDGEKLGQAKAEVDEIKEINDICKVLSLKIAQIIRGERTTDNLKEAVERLQSSAKASSGQEEKTKDILPDQEKKADAKN